MDEGIATEGASTAAEPLMDAPTGSSSNPFLGGSGQETPTNTFMEEIPMEYREKEYIKGINSMDDLMKKFDGAQSLIGKKTVGVPTAESTPEEWANHFKKLGTPEASDGYVFGEIKLAEGLDLPEGFDLQDAESMSFMKNTFHKANLTNDQANIIHAEHVNRLAETVAKQKEVQQAAADAQNKEFNDLAMDTFGEKTGEVLQNTNDMLAQYGDPKFKEHLQGLDNSSLILMASVLNNFKKANLTEDGNVSGAQTMGRATPTELRQKARELMKSPEFNDGGHSLHRAVNKRITDLYAEAARRDKSAR